MAVEVVAPTGDVEVNGSAWDVTVESDDLEVDVESCNGNVDVETGIVVGGVPYAGSYEANALFSEQVFPTAMKTMRADFTVHAINYTEAPNDTGITLTIGG